MDFYSHYLNDHHGNMLLFTLTRILDLGFVGILKLRSSQSYDLREMNANRLLSGTVIGFIANNTLSKNGPVLPLRYDTFVYGFVAVFDVTRIVNQIIRGEIPTPL